MRKTPKILLFDLETSPTKAYMWGMYQELLNSDMLFDEWYILCWSAKWLDDKKMLSDSIHLHEEFEKEPDNDRIIIQNLRNLLDEADIVITHNGDKFDCKKFNARCIYHGIEQPSPYMSIDTLKIARKYFAFTSNKLNDLSKFLKVGEKVFTGGFKLWKECLEGNKKSFNLMLKYCKNDVRLLEKVYLKLRPYIKNHPNFGVFLEEDRPCCPNCGSIHINYSGLLRTKTCAYKRFKCVDCGSWGRERLNQIAKGKVQGTSLGG